MSTLILLRHGKSDWPGGQPDQLRAMSLGPALLVSFVLTVVVCAPSRRRWSSSCPWRRSVFWSCW